MITSWDVYLLTRLDTVVGAGIVCFILGICAIALYLLITSLATDGECWIDPEAYPWFKGYIWKIAIMPVVAGIILLIVPSTKEYAAIYLIPKIANNEQVSKIPDNALKLLNAKMEEWIKGLGENKDKK